MRDKLKLSTFLLTAAVIFVLGFIMRLGADYYQYLEGIKSFPFYYYILGRGVTFLVPGILCLAGGKMLKPVRVKNKNK